MYSYLTRALRDRATDGMAYFHRFLHGDEWVAGIASAEDMPATLCGPFSRERKQ